MLNKNMVFCFTGKGPVPRSEMEEMAIQAGASVTKHVTSATTILVIMDMNSTSNKARKARENGVELIGPQTFFAMCNSHIKNSDIVYFAKNFLNSEKIVKEEKEQIKKSLLRKIII